MLMKTRLLVVLGWIVTLMKHSGGRSIGESVGVNFPDQASYQEYAGEQQEYIDPPGEAERQVRNVQETRADKYLQKEIVREARDSGAEEANTNIAEVGYQARINGNDDEMERPQGNEVVIDRRVMDMQGVKKEGEAAAGEGVERRDEDSLSQGNAEQSDSVADTAGFRRPRDNQDEETAKTEVGQAGGDAAVADAGYDAENGPVVGQVKENAYTGAETNYNYNYVQEQENVDAVEGGAPGGVAGNEEGAQPAQYEQGAN